MLRMMEEPLGLQGNDQIDLVSQCVTFRMEDKLPEGFIVGQEIHKGTCRKELFLLFENFPEKLPKLF